MKIKKTKIFLLLPVFIIVGCNWVADNYGFFPQTTNKDVVEELPAGVQEIYLTTRDKEILQCFFVANKDSRKIAVYFHGNAGNLYQRLPELLSLSQAGVNVLGVGYRGYGKSTGKPSEKGIIKDGWAALIYTKEKLGYAPEQIFIYGRSIGTVVAVEIARQKKRAGIILITPLTSGRAIAKEHGMGIFSFLAGDSFNNLAKCPQIKSPVLVIHGTEDEVTPYSMGKEILAALRSKKRMVTIAGGDHNGLEGKNPALYWNSITEFIQSHGSNK